ncbi:MAG: oligosaccharide flippase family protein, partial [Selenomonadales bacterium]|nr:oligosaccharide flippase family protein [Selenomonadales bacterium]
TAMCLFSLIAIIFALGLFFGSEIIATNILKNPGVKYTLMSLAPAIIFVAMSAVLRGYFVGMQNMMEYSKAQVLEQIINSIFSVIFVVMLLDSSPEIMAAGSTLATTVAASSAFLYLLIYYNKNKNDIWSEIKKSEKFALDSTKKIVKKLISYAFRA